MSERFIWFSSSTTTYTWPAVDEETKDKPKLSKAPRGYWRNLWRVPGAHLTQNSVFEDPKPEYLGDEKWLEVERWPSREIAEEKAIIKPEHAQRMIGWAKFGVGFAEYLGPVFFPEKT